MNAKVAAEEASKKTELEKKRKLLIEKKKRKESARADKELDSLFTNLYRTGKIRSCRKDFMGMTELKIGRGVLMLLGF